MLAPSHRRRALGAAALGALVFGLAAWARLRQAPVAMALNDAMGPWLVALASPWGAQPHAPPYGWALTPPYAACLALASSLWEAVCGMLLIHALVAPVAAWAALRLRPGAWAAALVAGAAAAVDGGLMDTAVSGSEGYLGALWLGLATLALVGRGGRWGPLIAPAALAMAVCNHPLAACAWPLLLLLPRRSSSALGLGLGGLLLAPRLLRLYTEGLAGGVGLEGAPWEALPAWLEQGGPVAWLILMGPALGLLRRGTRPLALAASASAGLMLLTGLWLGYLRDHHLRLLTVPFLVGWAGLPRGWALAGLVLLRPPPDHRPASGHPQRPGTLGLLSQVAEVVDGRAPRPLVADGARLSGAPAVEPSALMLDLHLRGWTAEELAPGGQIAVVVSGDRGQLGALPWVGEELGRWDRHRLLVGPPEQVRSLSEQLCPLRPQLGGAWDALAVLHPGLSVEQSRRWWGCDPAPEG